MQNRKREGSGSTPSIAVSNRDREFGPLINRHLRQTRLGFRPKRTTTDSRSETVARCESDRHRVRVVTPVLAVWSECVPVADSRHSHTRSPERSLRRQTTAATLRASCRTDMSATAEAEPANPCSYLDKVPLVAASAC